MYLMVSPKDKLAHRHTQRSCIVGAFWFSLVSCGCKKLEMCILHVWYLVSCFGGDVLILVCFDSWCLAYFADDLLIIA
jgi:hypothetical protein